MKKIKIFLGGYINSPNAQNINCLALAKNLDKSKFKITTLSLYSGNNIKPKLGENVKVIEVKYPHRVFKYYAYLRGVLWADIVYLPKGEAPLWNRSLTKALNKKGFNTIEGIYDPIAIKNAEKNFGSIKNMLLYYKSFTKNYSITKFLKNYNEKEVGLKSEEKILYLGADIGTFLNTGKTIDGLSHIVLIGNDLVRKGVYDYFELAKSFPHITFHIVGTGNGKIDVLSEIETREISNIKYHGGLTHEKLIELLESIDLHILPSRSEGFPKVTLETAAAGVPSLVYDDYGADEWITHGKDGFVVDTLDEMKTVIQELIDKPKLLQETSKNAIEMAKRFDWKVLVKEWEEEIIALAGEK